MQSQCEVTSLSNNHRQTELREPLHIVQWSIFFCHLGRCKVGQDLTDVSPANTLQLFFTSNVTTDE